jgi:hypothetical protein
MGAPRTRKAIDTPERVVSSNALLRTRPLALSGFEVGAHDGLPKVRRARCMAR